MMKTEISPYLLRGRWRPRFGLALFNLAGGGLSIGLVAAVAHFFASSFLFPSLGPTAFLLFYAPTAPVSSPRTPCSGI
jgi:CBS domain-containing membrane protein